jgi:hypothetical protein
MVAPYTLILTPNGSKKAWPGPLEKPLEGGGGGEPFSGKGSGGTQIIQQHRDCGTLYSI